MSERLQEEQQWKKVVAGDKDAFCSLIDLNLETLRRTARHELNYAISVGKLERDLLTPEELVGEVMARAWRDRKRRPQDLAVKTWLHALLFKIVDAVIRQQRMLGSTETVSLDAPLRDEFLYEDDESFYDWYQPDDVTMWRDIVPDDAPSPESVVIALENEKLDLSIVARRVIILHDALQISLAATARVLRLPVQTAQAYLVEARERLFGTTSSISGGS